MTPIRVSSDRSRRATLWSAPAFIPPTSNATRRTLRAHRDSRRPCGATVPLRSISPLSRADASTAFGNSICTRGTSRRARCSCAKPAERSRASTAARRRSTRAASLASNGRIHAELQGVLASEDKDAPMKAPLIARDPRPALSRCRGCGALAVGRTGRTARRAGRHARHRVSHALLGLSGQRGARRLASALWRSGAWLRACASSRRCCICAA